MTRAPSRDHAHYILGTKVFRTPQKGGNRLYQNYSLPMAVLKGAAFSETCADSLKMNLLTQYGKGFCSVFRNPLQLACTRTETS